MMTRSSMRKYLPEFSAIVLVTMFGLAIWAGTLRDQPAAMVEHTLEVRAAVSDLETALLKAQSGNRGFLLTGQDQYVTTFEEGVRVVEQRQADLKRLISDNPDQLAMLTAVEIDVDKRLELLRHSIEIRKAQGLEAAAAFVAQNNGTPLMLSIATKLDGMRAAEGRLLAQRRDKAQSAASLLELVSATGLLLAILASGAWIMRSRALTRQLQSTIAERETVEAHLRQVQKMEAIGQLTGGIAHDFNNMLAIIISALNLAERRLAKGDTDIQKFHSAAADAANRAATLTKRLMAFARQQALQPQVTQINKLVGGMSELITRSIGENIKVETVLAGGLWPCFVDPHQLENAILNLAVNARDAMPEGGSLTIETENAHLDERYARTHGVEAGQYVLIAVTDTGSGMTPEVVAKAFDPFFTTKPVGKGTGLGLSQVHGFVKQSGGHVKVYSEPDQGTTIKLYLPRPRGADVPVANEARRAVPAASGSGEFKVLVVEDDPAVRMATIAMVEELGYKVYEAEDAAKALTLLEDIPGISLLFTDIVMPQVNGRKLADEAVRRHADLKVLFTTGFTRNAIVHHGILDPGLDFLPKPFSLDELALKLQSIFADVKKTSAQGSPSD